LVFVPFLWSTKIHQIVKNKWLICRLSWMCPSWWANCVSDGLSGTSSVGCTSGTTGHSLWWIHIYIGTHLKTSGRVDLLRVTQRWCVTSNVRARRGSACVMMNADQSQGAATDDDRLWVNQPKKIINKISWTCNWRRETTWRCTGIHNVIFQTWTTGNRRDKHVSACLSRFSTQSGSGLPHIVFMERWHVGKRIDTKRMGLFPRVKRKTQHL